MRNPHASTVTEDVVQLIPALRAYSRALIRHSDEADDLVQETLVKAIGNVSRFEPGTNLRAWLFTIMRNTFFTSVHKRLRESPAEADCASINVISEPQTGMYIEGQRVMRAINALPEHHREILVLVVRGAAYGQEDERRLLSEFRKRVGDQADVRIEYVAQIERSQTGKLRFVISDVEQGRMVSSAGSGQKNP